MEPFPFGDYPAIVPPTSQLLDYLISQGAGTWGRLVRITLDDAAERIGGQLIGHIKHVFQPEGDEQTYLCYNECGELSAAYRKDPDCGCWKRHDRDRDTRDLVACLPSLHITFPDRRSGDIFTLYLRQIQEGQVHNPTLALLLSNLKHPIVLDNPRRPPTHG